LLSVGIKKAGFSKIFIVHGRSRICTKNNVSGSGIRNSYSYTELILSAPFINRQAMIIIFFILYPCIRVYN
jgi:hypothetical protein